VRAFVIAVSIKVFQLHYTYLISSNDYCEFCIFNLQCFILGDKILWFISYMQLPLGAVPDIVNLGIRKLLIFSNTLLRFSFVYSIANVTVEYLGHRVVLNKIY
jgi:hypothetical protein